MYEQDKDFVIRKFYHTKIEIVIITWNVRRYLSNKCSMYSMSEASKYLDEQKPQERQVNIALCI